MNVTGVGPVDHRANGQRSVSDFEFIRYETIDDGRIAAITLDRPKQRNAQNRGMLVELGAAFELAETDDTVRVVILRAAGPAFSAGHDLGSSDDVRERAPGPGPAPHLPVQRRNLRRGGVAQPAGVALLLREHQEMAEPAQDHHRPGARHGAVGRSDAGVVLRSDRRQ